MAKHRGDGRGSAARGDGRHRAGQLDKLQSTMTAEARAQLDREGGYDVGGRTQQRDAQRHSDSGQTHQRD